MAPATAVAAPTEAAVPSTARRCTRRMSMPSEAAVSLPSVKASSARPSVSSTAQPASMNGAASQTWVIERSVSEPSIQNMISNAAKGLGDRLSASEVMAPARLETATPARMMVSVLPRPPASACTTMTATIAPASAASGKAKGNSIVRPE